MLFTKHRVLTFLILTAIVLLSLVACAQTPAPATTDQQSGTTSQTSQEPGAPAAGSSDGAKRTLVVSGWGGLWEQTVTEAVYAPFEAQYNVDVVHSLNAGFAEALAKQRAELGNPTIDVFLTGGGFERIAADEDLLETLDPTRIPNLNDVYDDGIYKNQVVANSVAGVGLVYHTERVPRAPTSWYDLWDPAFDPVAISDISDTYGRALFAGITTFESSELGNPEAGWKKFEELVETKNPIINLTTDDTTNAIVARGAALSVAPNSRAIQLIKEGYPIGFVYPKEGGFAWGTYMGISKGTKNKDLAEQFINFWLDPQTQARWTAMVNYGPANEKTEMPADYQFTEHLIYHDTMKQAVFLNWDEINKHVGDWNETWTTRIVPKLDQ